MSAGLERRSKFSNPVVASAAPEGTREAVPAHS
jgi:hypothetical protein